VQDPPPITDAWSFLSDAETRPCKFLEHQADFPGDVGNFHAIGYDECTGDPMAYPIKVCAICSEEFELKPDKPGFANRCPACSTEESGKKDSAGPESKANSEMNAARRQAMRDLLYRKEG